MFSLQALPALCHSNFNQNHLFQSSSLDSEDINSMGHQLDQIHKQHECLHSIYISFTTIDEVKRTIEKASGKDYQS